MKYIKYASNHERPLIKHEEWAKIRRGAQIKPLYSLHHAPKQIIHRPKILCKIMAYKKDNETCVSRGPKTMRGPLENVKRSSKQ